jgi:hypothetical protein
MCLWLNTSINVINVAITVSIVSPLNTVYTTVSSHMLTQQVNTENNALYIQNSVPNSRKPMCPL